jgi:DNA-binding CsgD family transcriptional regulator
MRLSHKDYEALQRATLELYEHIDMQSFRRAVPGIFLGLVQGDYFLLIDYHLDPASGTLKVMDSLESGRRWIAEVRVLVKRRALAQRVARYCLAVGAPMPLKRPGFPSTRPFDTFAAGPSLRHDADMDRMISLPVISGRDNAYVINIGRCGKPYGERDHRVLNLIQPHYDQACRKLQPMETPEAKGARPACVCLLTPREREVLNWLGEGKSNPEIATILHAAVRTIEKHVERILDKLGVENRTAAALAAVRVCSGK